MRTELAAGNPSQIARVITWLLCAVNVLIHVGVSQQTGVTWDTLARWGYYSPLAVSAGAYWAYMTNVFVHLQFWHLAFNLYWLWQFGTRIITVTGVFAWILLFASLAFVSSGFQLLITGKTVLGASGIVYGYLGFLWTASKRYPTFEETVTNRILLYFLLWLILCLLTTALHVWEVANAAHIFGLGFGALLGAHLSSHRLWSGFALAEAIALILAAVPILGIRLPGGWR